MRLPYFVFSRKTPIINYQKQVQLAVMAHLLSVLLARQVVLAHFL
jgi:phosphoribosylpyrophosphate synthetase